MYVCVAKRQVNAYIKVQIPRRFSGRYINYPQVLELLHSQSHLTVKNAAIFCNWSYSYRTNFRSTWYHWVARGGVDSKLAQCFYTLPALRESNTRLLDLMSNAVTTNRVKCDAAFWFRMNAAARLLYLIIHFRHHTTNISHKSNDRNYVDLPARY